MLLTQTHNPMAVGGLYDTPDRNDQHVIIRGGVVRPSDDKRTVYIENIFFFFVHRVSSSFRETALNYHII